MSAMIVAEVPAGVAVTRVLLTPQGVPDASSVAAPHSVSGGRLSISPSVTLRGRYNVRVEIVEAGQQLDWHIDPVDLPIDDRLIVSPETLAVEAGIPLPITDAQRQVITNAILAAESDVYAYLGRPLMPMRYVQRNAYPHAVGWQLDQHGDDDIVAVLQATPLTDANGVPTGYYDVTYTAGINARDEAVYEPIRRFVTVHAMNSPSFVRMWQSTPAAKAARVVTSVSAEGQSMSWKPATLGGGDGKAGDGTPGSLPTLASLDRWRVAGRRVYQGPTRTGQWPYSGARWAL